MAVDITEFQKAVLRLQEALDQEKNEFLRDSVIQRFEFCVELAWKTSRRVMGTQESAPKDVIREMARANYITDVKVWLESIEMRNLSSHTYKEDLAEKVYSFAAQFLSELQDLAKTLEKKTS